MAVAALLFALALVRVAAAASAPLTEDEAYYRLWAQHLSFGYYDHPPMIAWWVRLGTTLFGDTALGIRALPVLSSFLASLVIVDLARVLGAARRTAVLAAIWYNATITIGLGSLLAVPDAPASLFWLLTLWCLARTGPGGLRWWLGAGAFAGLAVLSKYSALFLAPGVGLWLLSSRTGRARLRTPAPWLCAALAALIATPNLIWNARNHWVTMVKQFGRIAPERFAPVHLLEFIGLQSLLFGPILIYFVWRAVRSTTPFIRRAVVFIGVISAPFLGYLLLHSLHSTVEEHWPAPLFAGATILAALGTELSPPRKGLQALPLVGLLAPFAVAAYFALPPLGPPFSRLPDPALPVEGWSALSDKLAAVRAAHGAHWQGAVSYGAAAQLALVTPGPTPVLQLDERARYRGWAVPGFDPRQPGLVADLSRRVDTVMLGRCFAHIVDLGTVARGRPGGRQATYRLLLVDTPKVDIVNTGCSDYRHPPA